ncbi:methyltransferase domain-containing protein [Methylomarinum sp. Ch1-1]|uniref:Methyltransferase domain-containing protein n=1 Tax=Methylomarinum roseum TaxID=3067653 RepID=A0AAU7NPW2_9GAMM|nr:methyltransferase domain-containing protein [Methylomarinum sp. Ch1-1]MDP4521074.1 methyltransferase domain-containing protein [Methylomarinum sp. Ch1-1]
MHINDDEKNKLKDIKKFYESVYYKNTIADTHISKHNKNLVNKLNISEGQKILDVGCGNGSFLYAASQNNAIPTGIDLSTKAIEACKSIMPQGDFHAIPAESLPFEIDFITCLGSLEHFVNKKQAIEEMVRVAKSNAKFLILVPNADFLTRRLGLFKGTHQVEAKEEVLPLAQWRNLFESAGLEVTAKWKDLHVLSWSWILKDKWYKTPIRAIQAFALTVWPLHWQYQIYFLCHKK